MKDISTAARQRDLDRLAAQAGGFLLRWKLRDELRRACAVAPLWLFVGPLAIGLMHLGQWGSAPPSVWLLLAAAICGPVLYVAVRLILTIWRYHPARPAGLALFDQELRSHDRLVTADEFIGTPAAGSGFVQAAIDDADSYVRSALNVALGPRPLREWDVRPVSLVGAVAAALIIGLILFQAGPVQVTADREEQRSADSGGAALNGESRTSQQRLASRQEAPDRRPRLQQNSTEQERSGEQESPGRVPPGGQKPADGQTEAARSRMSQSSSSPSSSSGNPSGDKGASRPKPEQATPPQAAKPKDMPPRKPGDKPRENSLASEQTSGQGGASLSASTSSPFETPEQPDKSGADPKRNDPAEEAADEDRGEKANSVNTPSLRDRKAPVDRNASSRPSSDEVPKDANGRGGPGGRKKTRGVPSMILGIPVADRVPGMPNPGNARINQEDVKPALESHPDASAAERLARTGTAGSVKHPRLLPWMQSLVRDYFTSENKQTVHDAQTGKQ